MGQHSTAEGATGLLVKHELVMPTEEDSEESYGATRPKAMRELENTGAISSLSLLTAAAMGFVAPLPKRRGSR